MTSPFSMPVLLTVFLVALTLVFFVRPGSR